MSEHLAFNAAVLNETIYIIPDGAKLTISPTNANDLTHALSPNTETLVIAMPEQGQTLSEKGRLATERLLAALKQPEGAIALINLAEYPGLRFRELRAHATLKRILLLGTNLNALGIHVDNLMYKSFIFNGLEVLISDSLEVISDADKKLLWARLQQMFNLV